MPIPDDLVAEIRGRLRETDNFIANFLLAAEMSPDQLSAEVDLRQWVPQLVISVQTLSIAVGAILNELDPP